MKSDAGEVLRLVAELSPLVRFTVPRLDMNPADCGGSLTGLFPKQPGAPTPAIPTPP